MPTYKHKSGRIVKCTAGSKLDKRYANHPSYEVVGGADIDQHAETEAKAEEQYARNAEKRAKGQKKS